MAYSIGMRLLKVISILAYNYFTILDPMHLHGSRRIWDWAEIRPFSPVYMHIRPVRGSQICTVLQKRTNFSLVPNSSGTV